MERRELLQGMAAAVLAAWTAGAGAEEHDHHDHGGQHEHHDLPGQAALVDAAARCVARGQACLAHCLDSLGHGDTEMAACSHSVVQMLALCGALESLASQGSAHVPALARIAAEACDNCERECRKHADRHAVCRACAEACEACARACRSVV